MNKAFCLIIALLLSTSLAVAAEKPLINGQDDEVSYSVGHQVGRDLVRQGVAVNVEVLLQGIIDATAGNEPMIPFDTMIDTLSAFRERIVQQSKQKGQAIRRLGEQFLADNTKKDDVVTLKSGLQYKVLTLGKGRKPILGEMVKVNYVGKDIYGKIFDTTYRDGKDTPVQFKVENVIPGWIEGLQLMSEGSKWELYVPYQLAFKDAGPMAGQTVVFEIELVQIGE